MKLLFATHNNHKAQEIGALFQNTATIISLADIGFFEDIAETGLTLHENAQIKADQVNRISGLNCFADDTGLLVKSLNNAPGVYSARYAGPEKNFEANNAKLLKELEPFSDREAKFVTVICLILNQELHFFEGELKGVIINETRGNGGFGYDPVFVPENDTRTLAELSMAEKNGISHRAKAFAKMLAFLASLK